MSGKESIIRKPEYKLVEPNTILFLTGAPLSGKSTIAPLVTSSIEGLTLQPMDIVRLMAQEIENVKPIKQRNPFVNLGSCDSYTLIGDGSYSHDNLLQGFNSYSKAVGNLLLNIVPKLEAQGVQNLMFEGVQLAPVLVEPFLKNSNRLIVITSNREKFASNRKKVFEEDMDLLDRYSNEKLMILQQEIVRQARKLPKNKVVFIENTGEYVDSASEIIRFLYDSGVIAKM